jgi:hypothetical protein
LNKGKFFVCLNICQIRCYNFCLDVSNNIEIRVELLVWCFFCISYLDLFCKLCYKKLTSSWTLQQSLRNFAFSNFFFPLANMKRNKCKSPYLHCKKKLIIKIMANSDSHIILDIENDTSVHYACKTSLSHQLCIGEEKSHTVNLYTVTNITSYN